MQRTLEILALFILLALVAVRPLVVETYDSAESSITEALEGLTDPSPLRTLSFDLLILGAACCWLVGRAVGPAWRYRRTGLEAGVVILLAAAAISCAVAGNKRIALNASLDWLCLPLLTIVLVQLLHGAWHRRLLLAVVLASACAQAVQCVEQRFTFADTQAEYEEIKEAFWAEQGVALDSPQVELFERRMRAREAAGFFGHSNVAGSYLVLCALAALGLAIGRTREGSLAGVLPAAVGLAMLALGALVTRSRGALAAGAIGLSLWGGLWLLSGWIRAHRRQAFMLAWGLIGGGAVAVVGHGLYHGSLPTASLDFRWKYWQASARMIAEHPLTGVGRENFRRHYTQYKSIRAPEEVANPHNLFVQAATDWGLPGLIGILAMFAGGSVAVCGSREESAAGSLPRGVGEGQRGPPGRSFMLWFLGLLLVVALVRLPLIGAEDWNYLYYVTVLTGGAWIVGFFLFAPQVSSGDSSVVGGRLRTGVCVGLFGFLLHDMINFALFVPGAATTFFAVLAFVIAERAPGQSSQEPVAGRAGVLPALGTGMVTLCVAIFLVLPVARARDAMNAAASVGDSLSAGELSAQPAMIEFRRAAEADRLDPTPCVLRARWLMAVSSLELYRVEALRLAIDALEEAGERDPDNVSIYRMQSLVFGALAERSGDPIHLADAVKAARRVLELYPQSPRDMIKLGDYLLAAAEAAESAGLAREALRAYEEALELDQRRPDWETIQRLRPREAEEVEARMEDARALTDGG